MARIVGMIATSHTPTIGFALDTGKQQDPVWAPIFAGYEPVQKGLTTTALQKVIDEIQFEHPEVQATGLTPEKARDLCIGWRKNGTKANMVLIPLRSSTGEIVDFIGYSKEKGLKFSSHQLK